MRAVGHGVAGDALWLAYGGDVAGFLIGIPYAVFLLGMGLGTRTTAALPRWTGVLALGSAALFVIGAASVAGREVDGAPFVCPLMLAYVGITVWTTCIGVALLRGHATRAELSPLPA